MVAWACGMLGNGPAQDCRAVAFKLKPRLLSCDLHLIHKGIYLGLR